MARSYSDAVGPGAFVPTTDIFDSRNIQDMNVNSQQFKEFLVHLRQSLNDMALVLNIKDSGFYALEEFVNGQIYFPNPALSSITAQQPEQRQVFRKVINFGALPNGTKSVAHGITIDANTAITRMYAGATDPSTTFIPIPYASTTLVNNIELNANATHVNITTGIDRTGFTACYVVMEYIKQ